MIIHANLEKLQECFLAVYNKVNFTVCHSFACFKLFSLSKCLVNSREQQHEIMLDDAVIDNVLALPTPFIGHDQQLDIRTIFSTLSCPSLLFNVLKFVNCIEAHPNCFICLHQVLVLVKHILVGLKN